MTERRSFYRKVGYVVAIAVLWIPVSLLSQPASLDSQGQRTSGGKLAQLRDEYKLSEATLGEIDPTSITIELATLGLNGVAVQMLWESVHHYQMREDWASLQAVLEQLTRLQPHFWSVWDYLGHNLSYNISVEFDDYRDRFYWVMKGIDFLKKGRKYNDNDPRFIARIGWFYGNKIGKADEHVQYRKLLRKQQEEKGEEPDNWLIAYGLYREAQALVDSGRPLRVYISGEQEMRRNKPGERAPSPLLFHSEAAMALINHAETIEEEGTFGPQAKAAWEHAATEWRKFAGRDLSTAYGYSVRLFELEMLRTQIEELQKKLEEMLPGEKEQLHQAKVAKLTSDEQKLVAKPVRERTPEEHNAASMAEYKTRVTWEEVAVRAPEAKRPEARKMAAELAELEQKASTVDTFRDIVNYDYWWARCQAEPTEECLAARQQLYEAQQAYVATQLFTARKLYEEAFAKWRVVLDKYPILRENNIMADEIFDEIEKYQKVLGQVGEKMPAPFILQDVIDLHEGKRPAAESKTEPSKESPENKSAETTPREA